MKNKKIASILLAVVFILSSFASALAANLDLVEADGSAHSFAKWTFDGNLLGKATFFPQNYLIEVNGKNYKLNEVTVEVEHAAV